ncbi:hypothetical protein AXK57_08575 [Tsukamurella pulmonis]|uniref:hypothetical protein n=1 Tax=Tsukamurella pulmonis TaxID=47312 RepID=UPI00079AA3BF|nr:hypothetical protein [Tsukamurella pulmonis]KXP11379.1 hypothetical protein AXK57_08575 [Tsukamurella pulmonis]RDH11152.1 hypothetical protein DVB88_14330 [Tsukamurella pulmonis]
MAMGSPVGQVVHVVREFSAEPPAALGLPTRLTVAAKAILGGGLVIVTLGAGVLVHQLWTAADPPGLWFQLLFTAFPALVLLGFWFGYLASFGDAAQERDVERRWADLRGSARLGHGTVDERRVRTSDTGDVTAFVLEITGDGAPFSAQWQAGGGNGDGLLQPQVPGVGSAVNVWRTVPDGPLLVEVLDPTVVRP